MTRSSSKAIPTKTRRQAGVTWWSLSLPLLFFLLLPLAALLLRSSPGQIVHNLGDGMVLQAIRLSLFTSTAATIIAVFSGTQLAYLMARTSFTGKRLVDTLIDLPTVLPPAVAGVALLMAFGRRGIAGAALAGAGINIAFTQTAVIMAQTFIAAPLFVKTAVTGFAAIPPELEQAAAMDGANGWRVFWYVTLPLSRRALLTGAVLTWARALGEFGATIIFAGNFPGRTQTMPLAIYIGFELDLDIALTLSIILMGLSFLVLVTVKWLFQDDEAD
jgi:molybdate transport system permease protein